MANITKRAVKTASTTKADDTSDATIPAANPAHNPADLSAQAVAAQAVAADAGTGGDAFSAAVSDHKSDIEKALAERESVVGEMKSEYEQSAKDAKKAQNTQQKRHEELAHHVVPRTVEDIPPAVGPGPAPTPTTAPGTGVADPRDLAPGQDLSPCPPGGVSIAPQPNKEGSLFSKI